MEMLGNFYTTRFTKELRNIINIDVCTDTVGKCLKLHTKLTSKVTVLAPKIKSLKDKDLILSVDVILSEKFVFDETRCKILLT